MIKEIKFSEEFQRAFKRLKKRYRSLPEDFKALMSSLIDIPNKVRNFVTVCEKYVSVSLRKAVENVVVVVSLSA